MDAEYREQKRTLDAALQIKEDALYKLMHAYAEKVSNGKNGRFGTKKINKVFLSAGAARYAAAMQLLEM